MADLAAPSSTVERNCLLILVVIASAVVAYVLADILTPPALALFMAIVIDSFARAITRRLKWVSRAAAIPLAVVLSILLFGGSLVVIAENAASLALSSQPIPPSSMTSWPAAPTWFMRTMSRP